ncbi:MAG: M28 family peptidase [Planctomycetes bacterium]|nr:M28 family peptidase [Planctomycetota bacterium]
MTLPAIEDDVDFRVTREICAIAGRTTGTRGCADAMDLITRHVGRVTGRDVCIESFPVDVYTAPEAAVTCGDLACDAALLEHTAAGQPRAAGRTVYAGKGSEAQFRQAEVAGKLAIVDSDLGNHRLLQVERAVNRGAAGIIIISRSRDFPQHGAGATPGKPAPIPAVSVSGMDGKLLRNRVPAEAAILTAHGRKTVQGRNIIVDCGPRNGNRPTVVVGAHYDAWHRGAQDNGISAYLMFKLMRAAVTCGRRRDYRFIFFDAEEQGMLGSEYHVRQNDTGLYGWYLNIEMPVPAEGGRLRCIAYSRGMARYFSVLHSLAHGYLPVRLEWIYGLKKSIFPSDVHHFHVLGIPSLTTFCSSAVQHTGNDTLDRIRTGRLRHVLRILTRAMDKMECLCS